MLHTRTVLYTGTVQNRTGQDEWAWACSRRYCHQSKECLSAGRVSLFISFFVLLLMMCVYTTQRTNKRTTRKRKGEEGGRGGKVSYPSDEGIEGRRRHCCCCCCRCSKSTVNPSDSTRRAASHIASHRILRLMPSSTNWPMPPLLLHHLGPPPQSSSLSLTYELHFDDFHANTKLNWIDSVCCTVHRLE